MNQDKTPQQLKAEALEKLARLVLSGRRNK